ncbi:MAG: ParB/RepB/Spo0J family partition protein [Clostridia bacterium]|nr:ParB/RepB/Spo0J family partition protein [Clostridia bacterium]
MAKGGLGKGLGALFTNDTNPVTAPSLPEKESKDSVIMLKLSQVEPNREQPRKAFDEEKLAALADSIREHGVIQPILVQDIGNGQYQIIAGERRWRASRMAKIKEIPAIVRTYDEQTVMEVALIENLQRENLNPVEEALGYKCLMDEFNLTQEKIAQRVGKSRPAVANALRILSLTESVQKMLSDGLLSSGHARAILSLQTEVLQETLAERIVQEQLSVRQAEALAKILPNEKKKEKLKDKKKSVLDIELEQLQKSIGNRLGTKVQIINGAKKGKIEIEYYGGDDLERILKLLQL